MKKYLPFKQKNIDDKKIRTFDENIDPIELKWHRDKETRKVKIIESTNWKFQMDNELPKTLKEGDTLIIPKETFHRVIKGDGNLVIEVEFID
jgi:hypothetical protein